MLKNKAISVTIFSLIMFPVALWFSIHGFNLNFYGIGQLSGLIGMILFAISLILTARFKFFENYKDHHVLGTFSLILLLIHPLTLSLSNLSFSPLAAANYFIPTLQTSYILSGEISLIIMILLLVITFYFSLKYHVWKSTHQYLGLAFIIGFIHTLTASTDFQSNSTLKIYYIFISLTAIICYVYRTLLGKYLIIKATYRLVAINQITPTQTEFLMEPIGPRLNYYAGQYAFFQFQSQAVSTESHPFSIASSPQEQYLRVVIKKLGDYTSTVNQAKIGGLVKIEGPYGKFSPHFYPSINSVWIAGGVGITPFIGMARDLINTPRKADLYYAFSNPSDAIFLDLFKNIPNLNFYPCDSSINGRLTIDKISNYQGKDIFFCGPPPMIHGLIDQFIKAGVDKNRLISENFQF